MALFCTYGALKGKSEKLLFDLAVQGLPNVILLLEGIFRVNIVKFEGNLQH